MKKGLLIILALFMFVGIPNASAVPGDSEFSRARKSGRLTIRDCSLIETATTALIQDRRYVSVRGTKALKKTDRYKLNRGYRYFACGTSDADPTLTALWARSSSTGTPVEFTFEASDFPEVTNNLGSACRTIQSFPGNFVYKTIGSTHFPTSDCRRRTASIIGLRGSSRAPSCVSVLDSEGNVVAKMGAYSPPGAYSYRNYACYGCGGSTPYGGSTIASKARQNTGSSNIYFDFGSVCYGPISASTCRNSSQC